MKSEEKVYKKESPPPEQTLSRMIVLKFPAASERRSRSHKKYENTYSVKDKFKVKRKVLRIARDSAMKM